MSKSTKARKGREQTEYYVRIPYRLLESAAWRTLTPRAVCAFVYLLHGWRPGDSYVLPVCSIKWRMNHITRQKALDELITAGFIDVKDPGGLCPKRPAVFKLSERWKARSAALIADEAAGRAQGKLGWVPIRKRKAPENPQLFKKAAIKRPRPTKAALVANMASHKEAPAI